MVNVQWQILHFMTQFAQYILLQPKQFFLHPPSHNGDWQEKHSFTQVEHKLFPQDRHGLMKEKQSRQNDLGHLEQPFPADCPKNLVQFEQYSPGILASLIAELSTISLLFRMSSCGRL